jgi:prephenate dehydrogenase
MYTCIRPVPCGKTSPARRTGRRLWQVSEAEAGQARRAWVVGTGLIGASVGSALRERGWRVAGSDVDETQARLALEMGAVDSVGEDAGAELVVVCVPASKVVMAARHALRVAPEAVVTDVAGVKERIAAELSEGRFVPGHPMAGSEKSGAAAGDPRLFEGRTWVLTPTEATDPAAYAQVHAVVSSLGARPIATTPAHHDALVAVVSHVPHLLAAALMNLAVAEAEESAELLPLAAGGFRDMTRVAAGSPDIWPDVCSENADAISSVLKRLVRALEAIGDAVSRRDREAILAELRSARAARSALPSLEVAAPETVAEIRVAIRDRPGALAEVTTLAAGLGVNIEDVEIAHLPQGGGGVLVMVVDAAEASRLTDALSERGYHTEVRAL